MYSFLSLTVYSIWIIVFLDTCVILAPKCKVVNTLLKKQEKGY